MNKKTFYHIIEWAVALAACVFLGYKLVTFEDYPALWESLRGMAVRCADAGEYGD